MIPAPGFRDSVHDAQQVFRAALDALARPGTLLDVPASAPAVPGLGEAATALALTLADPKTPLWLGRGCAAAQPHLAFHCNAPEAASPERAVFAFQRADTDPRPLEAFTAGSEDYPDRSTTVVLEIAALGSGAPLTLAGAGIDGRRRIACTGLPEGFLAEWAANGRRFPRGVDVFLTTGRRLCGLPRTVRIEE